MPSKDIKNKQLLAIQIQEHMKEIIHHNLPKNWLVTTLEKESA